MNDTGLMWTALLSTQKETKYCFDNTRNDLRHRVIQTPFGEARLREWNSCTLIPMCPLTAMENKLTLCHIQEKRFGVERERQRERLITFIKKNIVIYVN